MNKPRYVVQWDAQPMHFCRTMCSLLESQILVDMTVISNSYSLKVHKCVMAANSPYFREQLQKEPSIDKVVMNGVKHSVMKALIEFIYCGETSIYEDNIHELIAVANYFELRGLKAILPNKIGVTCNENKDLLMQIKPPVFFCKNEKIRPVRHSSYVSDILYGDEDVKVVLDGNNYQVFDSKRRSQSSVVDEAHVALAKEEAASRFALQMLQKDLNVTSNLFVIEDTCTEATVETSLTAQFDGNQSEVVRDETEVQDGDPFKLPTLEKKVDKVEKVLEPPKELKCTEKMKECLQILQNDIPSDFPILYKSSEGYINVTSEMFKNLAQSGAIHYQVVHDDGHIGDYQQYICNEFTDIVTNQEDLNKCQLPKDNSPMTLKQLVAETVTPEFSDKTYIDGLNPTMSVMSGIAEQCIVGEISTHAQEPDMPYNSFLIGEKDVSFAHDDINKNMDDSEANLDGLNFENDKALATPLKRKRGRPRKIKIENEVCVKNVDGKMVKDKKSEENFVQLEVETFNSEEKSSKKSIDFEDLENEEQIEDNDEENEDAKKNSSIFKLISLNKDIPYAVGLLPLKNDKNVKSPKSKRRCTRSSNKENEETIQE